MHMPDIRFSIVIPSYNSAEYIEETLRSLANQVHKEFEVVLIDDGSKDNSVAVAKEAMQKLGLQGIVMERPDSEPKGVAGARNLGIKKATCEWICFLDSDDLFLPDKLAGTAALIAKYNTECCAYFHASRDFEDGTNKTLDVRELPPFSAPRDIFGELSRLNFITTSSVTIKKNLLEEIGGFDISLHGVEDYMLWLRIAKRSRWYYSNERWTDYRVRTTSLMGGRHFRYYVQQHHALILSAMHCKEFSKEEIGNIEHYFFDETMGYYSLIALEQRGWGDFMNGLSALAGVGRATLAARLFARHFKFLVLRKASRLLKKTSMYKPIVRK